MGGKRKLCVRLNAIEYKRDEFMRIVKTGFVGFLVGLLLAALLSQSVWLEMRIHVGKLIPWVTVVSIFLGLRKKVDSSFLVVLLLQGVLLLTFLFVYHFQWGALRVIPASLMREGIYLTGLSLQQANVVLVLLLAAGNLACMIARFAGGATPVENVAGDAGSLLF